MEQFRKLISQQKVTSRIAELAREIESRYPDEPPCVVAVMEGARKFGRHLMRQLGWATPTHEIRAQSYHDGTVSSGEVQVIGGESVPAAGRPVLLLEDIVDTGRTVQNLQEHFLAKGATDVQVASLLSKPARRVVDVEIAFLGFEIPDEFVIGFGMDYAGDYRELEYVAIYEEARAAQEG